MEVISGVPQGSILGPLLFHIYIDTITNLKLSAQSNLTLYVDDISLTFTDFGSSPLNVATLQDDIGQIHAWSLLNALRFNIKECKFMVFTKKHASVLLEHPPNLTLGAWHAFGKSTHI